MSENRCYYDSIEKVVFVFVKYYNETEESKKLFFMDLMGAIKPLEEKVYLAICWEGFSYEEFKEEAKKNFSETSHVLRQYFKEIVHYGMTTTTRIMAKTLAVTEDLPLLAKSFYNTKEEALQAIRAGLI
jgi:hypothetical protein